VASRGGSSVAALVYRTERSHTGRVEVRQYLVSDQVNLSRDCLVMGNDVIDDRMVVGIHFISFLVVAEPHVTARRVSAVR